MNFLSEINVAVRSLSREVRDCAPMITTWWRRRQTLAEIVTEVVTDVSNETYVTARKIRFTIPSPVEPPIERGRHVLVQRKLQCHFEEDPAASRG